MKTSLISVWKGEMGIRQISADLKQSGQYVDLLFCPTYADTIYTNRQLRSIVDGVEGSDLVGISCSVELAKPRVVQIAQVLKQLPNSPLVVLGGYAATFTPELALEHVDVVCLGEGEIPTREISDRLHSGKRDLAGIDNIWYNSNGRIVKNQHSPGPDLNSLPLVDYDYVDTTKGRHYRLVGNALTHINDAYTSMRDSDKIVTEYDDPLISAERESVLPMVVARGCVYSCEFCPNPRFTTVGGGPRIRKRSTKTVVDDIMQIRQLHPDIRRVALWDDDFFAQSIQDIVEFSELYKERVGLPLFVYGNPLTITEERLDALADTSTGAGLQVNMGVQSGSLRVLREVYGRPQTNGHVHEALEMLTKRVQDGTTKVPLIDFIVGDPWSKAGDIKQTIELVKTLPTPFDLHAHSFAFLPGTPLYERAIREGIIERPSSLLDCAASLEASAEYQDFARRVERLDGTERAYYILLMYCLAGSNTDEYRGSIPTDRLDWLLEESTKEGIEYLIDAFFKNHRVNHYFEESAIHEVRDGTDEQSIRFILENQFGIS